jgi:hypothetical protein
MPDAEAVVIVSPPEAAEPLVAAGAPAPGELLEELPPPLLHPTTSRPVITAAPIPAPILSTLGTSVTRARTLPAAVVRAVIRLFTFIVSF